MSTAGRTSRLQRTERTELTGSDFAAELKRLEEEGSESINGLVYADSNVGKTWLASTLPGRQLWLAGEPGFKTARAAGARGYVRRISDSAMAWAAVAWLEEVNPKSKKPRYESLDWLVLDGVTTMQDRIRLGYTAEAFDIDPTKRAHRNLPDRPDYFNTQNMLKSWVGRLVDMPVNLLITAHAYRTDLTDNGELLVFPGVQGKVTETSNAIAGLMDFVGYYERVRIRTKEGGESEEVRRLWFSSPRRKSRQEDEVRYIAGDKFNVLGPYIDNPTMPGILARISGTTEEKRNASA